MHLMWKCGLVEDIDVGPSNFAVTMVLMKASMRMGVRDTHGHQNCYFQM